MRTTVDLVKLIGVNGDILVRSGYALGVSELENFDTRLHGNDARPATDEDEGSDEPEFSVGHLFRRRYG